MFSCRSRHTGAIHQLLCAHFADMPQALSSEKAQAVAANLYLDLWQETIRNLHLAALRQVQRIKHNRPPWLYSGL